MSDFQKRALIVGINSILGVAIAEKLKSAYWVEGIYHLQTERIPKDILSKRVNELHTLKDNYDLVCFLSAYVPGKGVVQHSQLFETNVDLFDRVIKQFPSARVLHASSVSVYGSLQALLTEESQGKDVSPYGLSKLWAEQLLADHPSYACIRISSMYGRGMKKVTFLPMIIQDALTKRSINLKGDGSRRQNYIHVEDVASCFLAAASTESNGIFLAVSEKSKSNLEVAKMVREFVPETEITFQDEDHSASCDYNAALTQSRLQWSCQKNMETGIQELVQWVKEQY